MASIEIFFSYAHKDEKLREDLEKQLSLLKWQGLITGWHDRRIGAGREWSGEIDAHLDKAQIILLLISPDFMASDYCYGIEMKRAMERHERREAHVIPVILRPVDWHDALFAKLEILPTGGKAVTKWRNRDEAFLDVAKGIRKVVQELLQDLHVNGSPPRAEKDFFRREPSIAEVNDYHGTHRDKALLTGFEDLDRLTGGLQRSDLIIVAAPPAMGKTSFGLSIALNVAVKHAQSVGIFSLEMSKEQLTTRLISMVALVDQQRLRAGWIEDDEWERITYAMDKVSDLNIRIEDTANLTTTALRRRAHQLVNKHKVDLLIVDYVDLIQAEANQKQNENKAAEISRSLKVIARELKVPVLALVQMSRKIATRQSKVPQLSDIPGSFENDADIIIFIYRDDMYNPESERKNVADFIVAKHRNGPVGEISLYFQPNTTRFRDLMLNPQEHDTGRQS